MKILFLPKYPRMGASSRLRALQYVPYLNAEGFDVTVSNLFDEDYLHGVYKESSRSMQAVSRLYFKRLLVLLGSRKYDLIWIEKEIFPYLPAFAERWLKLSDKSYIVDYDDAIFHNYDLSARPLVRKVLGHKIDAVMRNASCVIVGNDYLGDRAIRARAARVELVPTVVDYLRYDVKLRFDAPRPIIGWIGSPSTQKYVIGIRDALRRVCSQHGARLLLVGATPEVTDELPGIDVTVAPWQEDSEADLVARMDIGIMPLLDGPWEKGKCGYKLIQYMACAVPVVASPVGVNVQIVEESGSGFLADCVQEWESALRQLLDSVDLRRAMGCAGRQSVEKHYSLQAQGPILARIFNEIIDKNKSR